MNTWARVLGVALVSVNLLSAQTTVVLSDDANHHLIKRVPAVYPQMAQIAHIAGQVTLRFTISATGEVADVQPVSGHPLLIQAAQAALKQWRYTPFEDAGHKISVVTSVVIDFPQGLPLAPEEMARKREKEKQIDQFQSALSACILNVDKRLFTEAEPFCRRALASSKTLGPEDVFSRMEAYKRMGHLLLAQGKNGEALEDYQEELRIAQTLPESNNYDLAQAHANVGNARRELGDLAGAARQYQDAESLYRRISKSTSSRFVKNESAYSFWQLLRSHAEMLRQMGQPDAATALDQEAAGIVIEENAPQ